MYFILLWFLCDLYTGKTLHSGAITQNSNASPNFENALMEIFGTNMSSYVDHPKDEYKLTVKSEGSTLPENRLLRNNNDQVLVDSSANSIHTQDERHRTVKHGRQTSLGFPRTSMNRTKLYGESPSRDQQTTMRREQFLPSSFARKLQHKWISSPNIGTNRSTVKPRKKMTYATNKMEAKSVKASNIQRGANILRTKHQVIAYRKPLHHFGKNINRHHSQVQGITIVPQNNANFQLVPFGTPTEILQQPLVQQQYWQPRHVVQFHTQQQGANYENPWDPLGLLKSWYQLFSTDPKLSPSTNALQNYQGPFVDTEKKSFLYVEKKPQLSPNQKLALCCQRRQLSGTCQSLCDYDKFTERSLVFAVLMNQCPGREMETAFNCATAMADHTVCCLRNGIGAYNNGRCMVFCRTHLGNPGNTLQYIDCLQVFDKIKSCYRGYHVNHPNIYGDY